MVIGWLLLTSMGCGETSPDTLVEELRAIASVAAPPEVGPAEPFEYTTYIFNPSEAPVDVWTWSCTNLGEGCLEALGGSESIVRTTVEGLAPTLTRTLSATPALAGILPETGALTATQVWTMLCEQGTCPALDIVENKGAAEEWPEDTIALLSDPLAWMSDLPTDGTGLAYQLITTSLAEERHQNPSIQSSPNNPDSLQKGEPFTLEFRVSGTFTDDARLYNYISSGGFEMTDTFVNVDDCTFLNGVAPDKEESVTVWVVLLDGFGGVDVWTREMEVR